MISVCDTNAVYYTYMNMYSLEVYKQQDTSALHLLHSWFHWQDTLSQFNS